MRSRLTPLAAAIAVVAAATGASVGVRQAVQPSAPAYKVVSAGGQRAYQTPQGTQAHSPTFGVPPKGVAAVLPPVTGVQTVEMFDTVTLSTVPSNPTALAGYTSGYWPTYLPLRHSYPSAHVVSIAVTPSYHADCLDVEPGDAVPAQAPAWVRGDQAAGFSKPCLYSSLSEWSSVRYYLNAAGISRSSYLAWDADWTYRAHLDAGFDATQWTDKAYGRNLDESTVTTAFLQIAQPPWSQPKPPPPPKPKPKPTYCYGHSSGNTSQWCKVVRGEVSNAYKEVDRIRGALESNSCRKLVSAGKYTPGPNAGRGFCKLLIDEGDSEHTFITANQH